MTEPSSGEAPRGRGARAGRRGHRHLGADPSGALHSIGEGTGHVVRLSAPRTVAVTPAGQHALWMATNLLARQFGVIAELRIAIPAVPLRDGIALLGAAGDLSATLAATARSIAGADIFVTSASEHDDARVAVELIIGDLSPTPPSAARQRIRVLGAGWGVFVGASVELVPDAALLDPNPFGPYFASCVGAGEAFKHLVGMRTGKGRFVDRLTFSLWDFAEHDSWSSMPAGVDPALVTVLPFYLVGAGAVGQAAAASLAATPVRGHVTVIDNDAVDDTNGNRCVLVTENDEGAPKATLVASVLQRAGVSAHGFKGTWQSYAVNLPHEGQLSALRAAEAAYRYELILSCVDKNTARHAIQNFWPKYLIGGSTDGLSIQVAAYDMQSPYECLRCSNPLEVGAGTIEEVAHQLRGLSIAERRARLEAAGVDAEAVERYLNDPRCGELGEQELSKFVAAPGRHDWSVGFVSVAAGVLLAAQLLKYAIGGAELAFPSSTGHTLRFSFLRPGPRRSMHRRIESCVCNHDGRVEWEALWTVSG